MTLKIKMAYRNNLIKPPGGGLIQNSTFKRGGLFERGAYSRGGAYSKRSFPEGGLIRDTLCFERSRMFTQKIVKILS